MKSFRFLSALTLSVATALLGVSGSASSEPSKEETSTSEWRTWNGHHYRMEGLQLVCYSEDGRRCSVNQPNPEKERPLRCDAMPRGKISGEGRYQVNGHLRKESWCHRAYANLFAKWQSYASLGHNVELATNPRGDVMCKSNDRTTCLAAGEGTSGPSGTLDPVVCGLVMNKRDGRTGYDDSKHWCSTPEIVVQQKDLMLKPAKDRLDDDLNRMVRIPVPGWQSKEQPAWILQFSTPIFTTLQLKLRGDDGIVHKKILYRDDPSGVRYAFLEIRGDRVYAANQEFESERQDALADSQGNGTLAMRMNADGKPQYFQAPGWPVNPFASKFEVAAGSLFDYTEHPRMLTPWMSSKDGSPDNAVEIWVANEDRHRFGQQIYVAPKVHSFMMTRTRQIPPH